MKTILLLTCLLPSICMAEPVTVSSSLTSAEPHPIAVVEPGADQTLGEIVPPEEIVREFEEDDYDPYSSDDDDYNYSEEESRKGSRRLFSWRTPWFAQVGSGLALTFSGEAGSGSYVGNETTIALGCWLSPIWGLRLSATSMSTKWKPYTMTPGNGATYEGKYNAYYLGGMAELLINPLAKEAGLKWNSDHGLFFALGAGYGTARKYNEMEQFLSSGDASLSVGLHVWKSIGNSLQFFVEPRYTYNIYAASGKSGDSNFGIDLGVTMNLHSPRFHCPDLCNDDSDDAAPVTFCRWMDVGLGGGFVTLQRRGIDYGGEGMDWNANIFGEYHVNNIFSIRTSLDFMTMSSNNMFPYMAGGTEQWDLYQVNTKNLFLAINPEWNITTLFGGCKDDAADRAVSRGPRFEMSAFVGPAASFQLSQNFIGATAESAAYAPCVESSKKTSIGFDAGIKLTHRLFAGLSVFFTPTFYFFQQDRDNISAKTVSFGKLHMYQTYTFGLQYRLDRIKLNLGGVKRMMKQYGKRGSQDLSRSEQKRLRGIMKRHRD